MVQFQIGLELTNIVNPLTQAISALGSLALVDAVKNAGSDVITEMRLASLIGRHRIDEVMDFHFREAVAKADKAFISRCVDIVLESGSGPTVQEALKNPALFSMVVQLSALCFSHEHQSLASAMVDAIENIVQEAGKETEIIPDYVSLLGTLCACQQQTSAFQWGPLYESVEYKIEASIKHPNPGRPGHEQKKRKITEDTTQDLTRIKERNLPFVILQSLLMWLHSLQNFPEHRLLHLNSDTGISTVVVWCHHVLGLGVVVHLGENEITFGKEPRNLIIEDCDPSAVGATLMDPADKHEPLFTLVSDDNVNRISREYRSQACGFGRKVLEHANATEDEMHYCSHWITARALAMLRPLDRTSEAEKSNVQTFTDDASCSLDESSETSFPAPAERAVLRAGQFLFISLESDQVEEHINKSPKNLPVMQKINWPALVTLTFSIARVQAHDLERCQNLPLSLDVHFQLHKLDHEIDQSWTQLVTQKPPDLIKSFTFLSRLLLGSMFAEEYVGQSVLVSAWGWSIFFDSVDAFDPADVSISTMRVLCGVPSRRGLRRARIIDGPFGAYSMTTVRLTLSEKPKIVFCPGVSTAKRGSVLIGHHSDAFSITQSFEWDSIDRDEKNKKTCRITQKRKLGFRFMQEICVQAVTIPHCDCQDRISNPVEWLNEHMCDPAQENSGQGIERDVEDHPDAPNGEVDQPTMDKYHRIFNWHWPKVSEETQERVIEVSYKSMTGLESEAEASTLMRASSHNANNIWFFSVSDNAAARWLQLDALCQTSESGLFLFLRGRNTCIRCATSYVGLKRHVHSLILL